METLLFFFLLRKENVSAHYMKNNQLSPLFFLLVCTLPMVCFSSLALLLGGKEELLIK